MSRTGTMLREMRLRNRLKVLELAEKAGVSAVYITQIEKHKFPSTEVLIRILSHLEISANETRYIISTYLNEKYPELVDLMNKAILL